MGQQTEEMTFSCSNRYRNTAGLISNNVKSLSRVENSSFKTNLPMIILLCLYRHTLNDGILASVIKTSVFTYLIESTVSKI